MLLLMLMSLLPVNLLIAMMSDTFGRVMSDAEAQWRTKFAGQVREFWDASILPTPFNFVEHLANAWKAENMEAKVNHYSAATVNTRSTLWGRHYVWPLPPAHFDLRSPHLNGGPTVREQQTLSDATTLRDLQHVSSELARRIEKSASQIERNFQADSIHAGSQTHIVLELIDTNAIIVDDHVGARMAAELGVAPWWHPGAEHSSCQAGSHGDVIGETVCAHADHKQCTSACAVALRLHTKDRNVILVKKSGVRLAIPPKARASADVYREAGGEQPALPISGAPLRRREFSQPHQPMHEPSQSDSELSNKVESMQRDIEKILAKLDSIGAAS